MGKVSSYTILFLLLLYISLLVYSLILIFRREVKLRFFVSVLIVLFLPFIGSLSYIIFCHGKKVG